MSIGPGGWRSFVFKNRGALLAPVALLLFVFGKPTVASASIGIAVAIAGELIRVWAVGYSGVTTRADVVTAAHLVTAGPYGIVRNPLYVGNAITAIGFWIALAGGVSIIEAAMLAIVTIVVVAGVYAVIVPLEEAYLAGHFGEAYRRYRERVPSFFPTGRSVSASDRYGTWSGGVIVRAEVFTLAFFALMAALVILKLGPFASFGVYF